MRARRRQILRVRHTRSGHGGPLVRFQQLCFDPLGAVLVLADQQGKLYRLDLNRNRWGCAHTHTCTHRTRTHARARTPAHTRTHGPHCCRVR